MQKSVIIIAACMLAGFPLASSANGITIEQLQSSCKYCKCLDKPLDDYFTAVQTNNWLQPSNKVFSSEVHRMEKLKNRIAQDENKEYNWIALAVMDSQMEDNINNHLDRIKADELYGRLLEPIKSIWDEEDCQEFFLYEMYKRDLLR